jgi:hypothetical protein
VKLVATHPIGTEIHLEGRRKHVKSIFDQWWLANSVAMSQSDGEPQEPSKNGAESQAERTFPRYFESEGIHQDIPIIQATTTRIPMGFNRNEEAA